MIRFNNHTDDATWYSSETAYWSSIEVNLSIVCASTPCLKPLLVRISPTFTSRPRTYSTNRSTRVQVFSNSKSFVELEEMSSTGIIVNEIQMGDSRNHSIEGAEH